jgi:hypothetical protein
MCLHHQMYVLMGAFLGINGVPADPGAETRTGP